MAVISIEYDEGSSRADLNYKSVGVSGYSESSKRKFDSGDFINDWYNAIKYALHELGNEPLCHSSSVDHFIMDGAKFESAYLHTDKVETGELLYFDRSNPNWWMDSYIDEQGIEMFVPAGERWTWAQLKEYCK